MKTLYIFALPSVMVKQTTKNDQTTQNPVGIKCIYVAVVKGAFVSFQFLLVLSKLTRYLMVIIIVIMKHLKTCY